MSNTKEATGVGRRYVARHRKEPSWTVGDLAAASGGLSAKIAIAGLAGLAGVALALPATSAFAAPSSLPPASLSGQKVQLAGSGSTHLLADVIKQTIPPTAPATAATGGAPVVVDGINLSADPGLIGRLRAAAATGTPVTIDGVTIDPDSPLVTQILSAPGGTAATTPATAPALSTP